MNVPLVARGRVLGVLSFGIAESDRAFGADDLAVAQQLAQRAALAIDNARLFAAERQAREEAERARAAAEAANRAKADFLATMSHELRTPIHAALGYGELLALGLHGPLTDGQREALGRIRRSQQRLLALVNDVLSFARLDAGQLRLETADVPLAELLADVEALMRPQLDARGLAYASADAGTAAVRADRDRVEQILLNLLSNACKFTPPGGTVRVACATAGDAVRITVADTGRGIAPEQQDAVFEPFVQVDGGLTRTSEGTGLGLAISRTLARAMGGDLTLASAPGAGAAFTLALPASHDSSEG
jgi:signal transduction histidine kinase